MCSPADQNRGGASLFRFGIYLRVFAYFSGKQKDAVQAINLYGVFLYVVLLLRSAPAPENKKQAEPAAKQRHDAAPYKGRPEIPRIGIVVVLQHKADDRGEIKAFRCGIHHQAVIRKPPAQNGPQTACAEKNGAEGQRFSLPAPKAKGRPQTPKESRQLSLCHELTPFSVRESHSHAMQPGSGRLLLTVPQNIWQAPVQLRHDPFLSDD